MARLSPPSRRDIITFRSNLITEEEGGGGGGGSSWISASSLKLKRGGPARGINDTTSCVGFLPNGGTRREFLLFAPNNSCFCNFFFSLLLFFSPLSLCDQTVVDHRKRIKIIRSGK